MQSEIPFRPSPSMNIISVGSNAFEFNCWIMIQSWLGTTFVFSLSLSFLFSARARVCVCVSVWAGRIWERPQRRLPSSRYTPAHLVQIGRCLGWNTAQLISQRYSILLDSIEFNYEMATLMDWRWSNPLTLFAVWDRRRFSNVIQIGWTVVFEYSNCWSAVALDKTHDWLNSSVSNE